MSGNRNPAGNGLMWFIALAVLAVLLYVGVKSYQEAHPAPGVSCVAHDPSQPPVCNGPVKK